MLTFPRIILRKKAKLVSNMWNKGTILEKYLDDMRFWPKILVFWKMFSCLAHIFAKMLFFFFSKCVWQNEKCNNFFILATMFAKTESVRLFLRKVSRDRNEWQNLTKTKRNFAVSRKFKNEFLFKFSCNESVFCNLWCFEWKNELTTDLMVPSRIGAGLLLMWKVVLIVGSLWIY